MRVELELTAAEATRANLLGKTRAISAKLVVHFLHSLLEFFEANPEYVDVPMETQWLEFLCWDMTRCLERNGTTDVVNTLKENTIMPEANRSSEASSSSNLQSSDIKEGDRYQIAQGTDNVIVRAERIDRTKGVVHWKHLSGPLSVGPPLNGETTGEMPLNDFTRSFKRAA